MMTIAAVLTVAVSLSLVGAALLLKQSAAQASAQLAAGHPGRPSGCRPTASPTEIDNVKTAAAPTCPSSSTASFCTQAQDYAEAKKLLPLDEWQVLTGRRHALVVPLRAHGARRRLHGRHAVQEASPASTR